MSGTPRRCWRTPSFRRAGQPSLPVSMLNEEQLLAQLRQVGTERYHDRHPFHTRMHAGELSKPELQAWVENRFYYQTRIPIKDALIVAKSEDPAFRRMWLRRIVDHDGSEPGTGGL